MDEQQKQGLLGKIVGGIGGLLKHPITQGIAGAAAFGANPLLGLLAAPGIKSSSERSRMSLEDARSRLDAREELSGLLSETQTVQQPSRTGGLLDVETGGTDTFNLPGRRETTAAVNTPEGRQRMLGLLSEVAPQVTAQSLLNPRGGARPSAFEQKLGAFSQFFPDGVPDKPTSTQNALLNFLGAGGTPLDPNVALLSGLAADDRQREARDALLAEEDRIIDTQSGLTTAGKRIESISDSLQKLGGTFLQPGLGATKARRSAAQLWSAVSQFATGNVPQTQKDLAVFDTFTKDTANLLSDIASSLSGSGGLGTFTDSKLALIAQGAANADIQPQAIMRILSTTAADMLVEEAKLRLRRPGFSIPNREFLEVMASGGGNTELFGAPAPDPAPAAEQRFVAPPLPFDPSFAEQVPK